VLQAWWTKLTDLDPWTVFWLVFGFSAQGFFAARFVWQWLVSEKRGRSTVPLGFWILSLLGGCMLLIYACHLKDPVFIAGQGLGLFIYIRNLMLIRRRRRLVQRRHPAWRQQPSGIPISRTAQDRKCLPLPTTTSHPLNRE
jgi:lipid-A-disaccharide synthase-like uncharacterized protein